MERKGQKQRPMESNYESSRGRTTDNKPVTRMKEEHIVRRILDMTISGKTRRCIYNRGGMS